MRGIKAALRKDVGKQIANLLGCEMRRILNSSYRILVSLIIGFGLISACHEQIESKDTQVVFGVDPTPQTPTSTAGTKESDYTGETSTASTEELSYPEITPNPNIIWEMIGQVNQERALSDLRRLTGVEPICTVNGCYTITNRETGSEGLQWAKDYIYDHLVDLGYYVEIQDWSRDGYTDQNLIARIQGRFYPGEEIVFIAHLDGYLGNNPAADDDASGVVSLMELARILSSRVLSRTAVLIFSTGEEQGALGSRSYVDQLTSAQLSAIKYVISVEMLGYDSNNDGAMQLWSGDQPTSFVQMLSQIITTYQLHLTPEIVTGCA
jgi:hypothetical protein